MHTRPVWAEISHQNLISNYLELRRMAVIPEIQGAAAEVLAVVKANAYGHGLLNCAPSLVVAGAQWIGVTSVEEGIAARTVCPLAKILIMSGIFEGEATAVIEHRLTPIVWESYHLDLLEEASSHTGLQPQSTAVHLELDTGMARQGVPIPMLAKMLDRFHAQSPLHLEASNLLAGFIRV